MKRTFRKWTSLSVILIMLLTTIMPLTAYGASAQISITNLYNVTNSSVTPVKPANDVSVQRFTTSSITVSAAIQNISDDQVTNIYYVIENYSTGVKTTNQTNKANHQSGAFDIVFNNVQLTEGLNKITILFGSSSVTSSAPGWAYFTATTNISNIQVNNAALDPTKMYPDNPLLGSAVTIKGDAANATSVQAFVLGNSTPKDAFLNNGSFSFTADDASKNNISASFGLQPGDNLMTLVAKNSTKSYQTQQNLIYDNAQPFAFNAKIQAEDANKLPVGPIKDLITIPTITSQNAQITAQLKDDLAGGNANSPLKYRYVDVVTNGQVVGTYDLGGAATASRAFSIDQTQFTEGYADTDISITGTGLDSSGLSVTLEDNTAAAITLAQQLTRPYISSDKQTAVYTILGKVSAAALPTPVPEMISAKSPYKLTVKDGQTILNSFTITVLPVSATVTAATITNITTFPAPALIQGYATSTQTITFNGTAAPTPNAVTVDILKFDGQGAPVASYIGKAAVPIAGNKVDFDILPGLIEGNYKMRITYGTTVLAQRSFSVGRAAPTTPVVITPASPTVLPGFTGVPGLAPATTTTAVYFAVTGTNLATNVTDISALTIAQDLTAGPQAAFGAATITVSDPNAISMKYTVNAARQAAATVQTSGAAYTVPLTAAALTTAKTSAVATGDHLSVVSLDVAGNIIGYNDYTVTIVGAAISAVSAPLTVTGTANATTIVPYLAQGTNIIFKVNTPSESFFVDGVTYKLTFTQKLRYSDGTLSALTAPITVTNIARTNLLVGQTSYNIDKPYVTNVTPLQIDSGLTQSTTNITITGVNLNTKSQMTGVVLNEDGSPVGAGTSLSISTTLGSSTTAIANLPASLAPGNYLLRVLYSGYILTQYPFVLSNARLTAISPVAASSSNNVITAIGTGLGRDETKFKLSFSFDNDPTVVIPTQSVTPNTLALGKSVQFPVPSNLMQGTYTVTLLYNNVSVGTASYTVNSAPTILKENSALSRASRYKVFDFSADLAVSISKIQNIQFQFYNVTTDKAGLPPRLFVFNYIDPTLPYVDYVSKGDRSTSSDFPLSLTSSNQINELPEWFNVYADRNTNKVNVYLGDFNSNTAIYKTMLFTPPVGADYNVTTTVSGLSAANVFTTAGSATAGVFQLTIGGAGWAVGDQIVIDNRTFTITNGVTSANSFDFGNGTNSTLAANLTAALAFNSGLTAKYTIALAGAGSNKINFTQKTSYETNVPLTVSDTSATGTSVVTTTTPYAAGSTGVSTTTFNGTASGADSITVTLTGGGLTLPITSDSINVKGKTLNQVASSIASKLAQIGVNGYTVSNASGTNVVVFTQNHAFTTSSAITVTINGGYNIYSFRVSGLANGQTKLTAVPSNLNSANPPKGGESLTGDRTYDLSILSTPYVILNNIYNGIILKDDPSTAIVENQTNLLTCTTGGTLLASCFTGRLVNVPSNEYANVEVSINGVKSNLRNPALPVPPTATSDFDDLTYGIFHFQFGASAAPTERQAPLQEGKNTIKFSIYGNGVLLTESSYDVFVFSNTAPSFASVKPDESAFNVNVIKYVPTVADSYSTSETVVSLAGQFINADDIKLIVKYTDDTGQQVTNYDRRYGLGFLTPDPVNGNPNYLNLAGQATGNFRTNPITLGKKGSTTFEFTITNSTKITVVRTITITREPLPFKVIWPILTLNAKKESQANINGNYIQIEVEAEGADKVTFGKDDAIPRQVTDANNNQVTHYFYEAKDLKVGANKIAFTVKIGSKVLPGTFNLINTNTSLEGGQFKTALKSKMTAFNGEVDLSFPKDTNLMRNDPNAVNQYLTSNRQILFGIANKDDGRVDKYKHPAGSDGQLNNPNPLIPAQAPLLLTEPTHRFRQASKLYWIDAGTISANETDMDKALNGSGREPYDAENFFSRNIKDLVVPTKRGTLKLQFDPNIRADSSKYITVYHYDIYEDYTGSVQYRWRNIGGIVDNAKNTITVPFDTFGYYQVMYMDKSFDDVSGHAWAKDQLDILYSKGIMINKDSSNFVPNDPIGRGEFTTLLVKIFDIPLQYTSTPTFSDVQRVSTATNGLYDYMSIETAAKAGIVRGGGGGRFSPDSTITRQDAASMIARAANMKLVNDPDIALKNLQKVFTDGSTIDLYARAAVDAVSKAGLIAGKENVLLQGSKKTTFRFDPTGTLTRAEAAQVAIQVLKQLKKLPK